MRCQATQRNGQPCSVKKHGKRYKRDDGDGYIYLCGRHDQKYRKQILSPSSGTCGTYMQHTDRGYSDLYGKIGRIYDNQIKAAKSIAQKFVDSVRMVLLVALMQLGKTGTMQTVIHYARKNISEDIVPFVIMPVHDTEVLQQARADFTRGGLVDYNNIFGTTELNRIQYLKDAMERAGDKPKLLIIDESHMRCKKDASLDRFLRKAGVYLNGDQVRDDVYILTVSATPNAETALLTYREIRAKKHMVVLEPTSTYYGVTDMLRLGRLRSAWSLKEDDGIRRACDTIDEFMHLNKYMLIRCHNDGALKPLHSELMERYGARVKIIDYSQRNSIKDINSIVGTEPSKPTVILLAERLRASKRLNTEHVSMCFGWCDSISSTMQGLLGRCCGHHKEGHGVIIYTNLKHAEIYSSWAQNMYNPFGTPSDRSHYVTGGVTSKTLSWSYNVPVELELDQTARDLIRGLNRPFRYEHLTHHMKALWEEQQPRLAVRYPNPIKSSGISVVVPQNSDEPENNWSAQSVYNKFWIVPNRAHAEHRRIVGFETTSIRRTIEGGWYMYINRATMRCIVCYSHRARPSSDPIVSDDCAYKPSHPLTRATQTSRVGPVRVRARTTRARPRAIPRIRQT